MHSYTLSVSLRYIILRYTICIHMALPVYAPEHFHLLYSYMALLDRFPLLFNYKDPLPYTIAT